MPQIGPRGFRFSHLSRDHQKTVQWWMRNEGSTVDDERCMPEVSAFASCVDSHSYDLAMCKPEIRSLETCVARMEADSTAKRNVEKTVIAARQDMRQLMLNKLRNHPLTWARRNPLKQFLR